VHRNLRRSWSRGAACTLRSTVLKPWTRCRVQVAEKQSKITRPPKISLHRTGFIDSEITSLMGIRIRIDQGATIPNRSNDPIALGTTSAPKENPIPDFEAAIRIPFTRHCDHFHVALRNERVHSALVNGLSTVASGDLLRTGRMHFPSNSPGARPRAKACPVLRMPSWWHHHHLTRPGTVH